MTDAQKRAYVSNLYNGHRWKKRVEQMQDDQVLAIYLGHQKDGTVPEHDEDESYSAEEPLLGSLEIRELAPRPPHTNEDQFPIY